MGTAISTIVAELRRDHQNMRILLDLVEGEADVLYGGGDPDFELLDDVMRYMTVYPDVVHHPREDELYAEMRRVRPDLSAGFQRIQSDHRHIEHAGRAVRQLFASLSTGTVRRRGDVISEVLRYVHNMRNHMQWEELDLFRRALLMARDGHPQIDEERAPPTADPVFGGTVEDSFERLYRQILRARSQPVRAIE